MTRTLLLLAVLTSCTQSEPPRPRIHRGPQPEAEAEPSRTTAEIREQGNHLVGEASPYLLQHAHNPVDWYPFGEEALARARELNRPIFLSIGYSTCHWCHVMEEESFENDEIARTLNRDFIAIKVDREQRPDIDALYIEAVRQLGGSTGWPLSVFLTPNLVPYFGGTYFPPRSRGGRPGFLDVLRQVRTQWDDEGEGVESRGRQIFAAIERQAAQLSGGRAPITAASIDGAFERLRGARDPQYGGFGRRQKFPNAPLLLAELRYFERTDDAAARAHLVLTLEQAMRGGIHDHLFGTFHRYAVDQRWHVPHFEKTLYDNAQLAQVYVEAGRALGRPDFVAVGRGVLDDLIERWQEDDGGFVVGFDADDPGGEGYYYTWTPAELTAALGAEEGARFATIFGVTSAGERLIEGRSVLHRADELQLRVRASITPAEADLAFARARERLVAARARRRPPATDDKELAAWNGLAIIALANVGRWLDEPRYVAAAQRAARFILERCFDGERMLRGRRDGESLGEGFLDDHAIPILGLLRLHAADGDPRWLEGARTIGRVMVSRFHDASAHTFLHTARADIPEGLPLRRPDLDDGVLPSGGHAATLAALELGAIAGDRELHELGESAARAAAPHAARNPFGSGFQLVVLDHIVSPTREVVIAGDAADPATRALFALIRPTLPSRVLAVRVPSAGAPDSLVARFGALRAKAAIDGRPTAYVCEIGRCELPTSDPAQLARQLAPVLAARH